MAAINAKLKEWSQLSFSQYLKMYLFNKDVPYGGYFDYTEYMWSLRDKPNILVIFFEDLKTVCLKQSLYLYYFLSK